MKMFSFLALGFVLFSSLLSAQTRSLDFNGRVSCQEAIDSVYWKYTLWPKDNPLPKPTFESISNRALIQRKVKALMSKSDALERIIGRQLSGEILQSELDRIAVHTRKPEVLNEIFAVLHNDSFLVAECLARPSYVTRINAETARGVSNATREKWNSYYRLPPLVQSNSGSDYWTPTSSPPDDRTGNVLIWTGTELIVWGGLAGNLVNSGERYDPVVDVWYAMTGANAPEARTEATAVWTGTEMIVWGGSAGSKTLNTGGRYNPTTDSWTETSMANVPLPRSGHTAIWTGKEMIVWGGMALQNNIETGGRYDPSTDRWTPISMNHGLLPRKWHTAVWTGKEMIIWGGIYLFVGGSYDDGARYDPSTDAWSAINTDNAPTARYHHSAIWTNSEMIIWGGLGPGGLTNTGSRYDPVYDDWTPTDVQSAPTPRQSACTVWTGQEMLVWGGGQPGGALYSPIANIWVTISTQNAPTSSTVTQGVWTGEFLYVWGGISTVNAARYDPASDSWFITSPGGVPTARKNQASVFTGTHVIVWGGETSTHSFVGGASYDFATDTWADMPLQKSPGWASTAVWTGIDMIAFGGGGAKYNPISDQWTTISTVNQPQNRYGGTAVWTGTEMIVWGGPGTTDSGRYNPQTDTWTLLSAVNQPTGLESSTAVWTGTDLITYGGGPLNPGTQPIGNRYNLQTDQWSPISKDNSPGLRYRHSAVWTGQEMLVWGGAPSGISNVVLGNGARYNPTTDTWRAMSTTGAPSKREFHTAIWDGVYMDVWGGDDSTNLYFSDGARYDPVSDTWSSMNLWGAPSSRSHHSAAFACNQFTVWGGLTYNNRLLNTGGSYFFANPTMTETIPDATTVDIPYTANIAVTPVPYDLVFQLSTGTLPPGLTLSSTGTIWGVPNTVGSYTFSISALDIRGCSFSHSYTIHVDCPWIAISPGNLPGGFKNVPYDTTMVASNGKAPYNFFVLGSLPDGLQLLPNGQITGTPSVEGPFTFLSQVLDSHSCFGFRETTLTVGSTPPAEVSVMKASRQGGSVQVQFTPACNATQNTVYAGMSGAVAGVQWTESFCDIGNTGNSLVAIPDPPANHFYYFVIAPRNDSAEGSYGSGSDQVERPEANGLPCDYTKQPVSSCN